MGRLDTMKERLEKLPAGLLALFQDMWGRLNEVEDIYRNPAAISLNITLTWNRELQHTAVTSLNESSSLDHIIFAEDPELAKHFVTLDNQPSHLGKLGQRRHETKRRLKTHCAGLVMVTDEGAVHLVHRSAIEFLLGTLDGADILRHDTVPWSEHIYDLIMASIADNVHNTGRLANCPGTML